MIKNYLKVALRNISRHKVYSFINILGLAIGLTACILILLYLQYELSYDRWNDKADRIYRIALHGILGENEFNGSVACAPLAKTLIAEFPEVESTARIRTYGYPVLRYNEKVFSEELFYHVDSTFFDVFTIEFLMGDPKTCLSEPNTVVLTELMMKKYFGDEDPIGKIINSDNRTDWKVTGVIKDFPKNSHFHPDFLASFLNNEGDQNIWVSNNYSTYVLLKEGHNYKDLEAKFPDLVRKYVGPQIQQFLGVSWDQLVANGAAYEYFLQPLTDIHLKSHLDFELEPNGNALYITLFSIIAMFILIIACINFMNLATARSANRAREVGIRKTLGSNRSQLIGQFLTESIIITFIAVVIAMIFVKLLLPQFNNLIQTSLIINYFSNIYIIPLLLLTAVVVGGLAGVYPAFYLASFRPVKVLKGEKQKGGREATLRSILVVFQFLISIALFTGSFIIYRQLSFMQNRDLGFNKDNLIIVEKTDDIAQSFAAFKKGLLENPTIISVANSRTVPGRNIGNSVYSHSDAANEDSKLLNVDATDIDFTETYGIPMVAGRFFIAGRSTDSTGVILNESAVRELGIENPVGKYLTQTGQNSDEILKYEIMGVMKDFHYQSLHRKIEPLVMFFNRFNAGRTTTVRIDPKYKKEAIQHIESTWYKYAGNQAFEYVFLDDDFNRLYLSEIRTRQIVTIFSTLAIFIACLGLFGLASFTTEQRTKEIGIRKAMGASVPSIFTLLSKDILKLVLLAALIALPASYYMMSNWLQNFAYRIGYSIFGFILSTVIAGIIAILTISKQTYKAASANPVDALKYE
ncbi:ABC transporter permease [bacterium]|nr:ABC transporter permease [bacterium]MBU1063976.1 ABC transporter permease [bacterium]MBU1634723.1 ABC transporter permease [bacterium]MBU1874429.1 ABC transporter permease [bacterium]